VRAPVRIGLQIPRFDFPGVGPEALFEKLVEIASTAEASGFDSLFVMDHLHQIPGVGPQTERMLEGNTILAAIAARTTRLNVGLMVGSVTYRNPALHAKITTTIDVISGGQRSTRSAPVGSRTSTAPTAIPALKGASSSSRTP
jgi:alkanesulfonate monooxygenase SsuD/methylene tetrahydromethanopterin reductase-like flavin-dependent oxidoreductase (luciferase family)